MDGFGVIGKGMVFAVGDPWLYNEYIDTRRLPAGYENAQAGKNLFHGFSNMHNALLNNWNN